LCGAATRRPRPATTWTLRVSSGSLSGSRRRGGFRRADEGRYLVGAAIEAGQIRPLPVTELANALLGALVEAALYVSRSEESEAAQVAMTEILRGVLDGLRPATA
jgi:hypothetical protein